MAKEFSGNEANLVALYHLEDATDSKGSYDLTNNGSTPFNAAKFSNGADYNGSTQWLSRADNLGITGANSISMITWIQLDSEVSSGQYTIIQHNDTTNDRTCYIQYHYNGGTRRLQFARGGFATGSAFASVYYTIALGTTDWYMLAVTHNVSSGYLYAYVNGDEVGNDNTAMGGDLNINDYINLGAWEGGSDIWNGRQDETAIFDAEKSGSFIKSYYEEASQQVAMGSPMIFMKEVWEKRDRLFLPKKKLWTPRLV